MTQPRSLPLPDAQQKVRLPGCSAYGLAVALALAIFPVTQAQAQTFDPTPRITAGQIVTVEGRTSFDAPLVTDSYMMENGLGSGEYDFSSFPGIQRGSLSWDNSLDAQGFVRSKSELNIYNDFSVDETDNFVELFVQATNYVSYFDLLQVRDLAPEGSPDRAPFDQPYIIRFQTRLTGDLTNTVNYNNLSETAIKAEYFTLVEFSGRFASTGGDADTPFEIGDTYKMQDAFPVDENVNESDTILVDVFFEDQVFDIRDGIFFSFEYEDFFEVDIDNIETGSIDILMENDFGSTIKTTASIFDTDGNLMPFLRAYSETFDYEMELNPVPIPAAAWLFGSALLGLGVLKRRKA